MGRPTLCFDTFSELPRRARPGTPGVFFAPRTTLARLTRRAHFTHRYTVCRVVCCADEGRDLYPAVGRVLNPRFLRPHGSRAQCGFPYSDSAADGPLSVKLIDCGGLMFLQIEPAITQTERVSDNADEWLAFRAGFRTSILRQTGRCLLKRLTAEV